MTFGVSAPDQPSRDIVELVGVWAKLLYPVRQVDQRGRANVRTIGIAEIHHERFARERRIGHLRAGVVDERERAADRTGALAGAARRCEHRNAQGGGRTDPNAISATKMTR